SGFSYEMSFDGKAQEDDQVVEYEGVRVVVDSTSAPYLAGTEIDFVHSLHGGGVKFVNPAARQTCGCGSSFAVCVLRGRAPETRTSSFLSTAPSSSPSPACYPS